MLPDFRVRQRDYLLEIARALTEELDLNALLNRILGVSVEMLAGQAGLIALRTEAGGWKVQVSQGIPPAFLRLVTPYLSQIPEKDEPERFEIPEINRLLKELTRSASLGLMSGVGLPLVARKKVVGVIFIFRSYPDLFSGNDRTLLSSFANQAAIAVQNAQLYTQINRDRERLSALLDTPGDGILILRPDLKIERCNPAATFMLGLPAEQIQERPHEDVIRWIRPPQGLTLEQAAAGGWPLTRHANLYVEGDLQRGPDQPPLPVGITYSPLISADNTLLNIFASMRDITRFRQAEEMKSTFISVISHELKTPVALIKGYVSTLRRDDVTWDSGIVQEGLQVIEEEADRLSLLIENLLDASRLQSGGLALKRTDISIPDMARRIAGRMQTQSDKHTILLSFPQDFPVIVADEQRLEQVLSNLIGNAIKYSPSGEITVSGQVRPDVVMLCVSDQGPGISPQDIPHIFDRFYRGPDMARQTKGAGLGLYLTRSIVEAHGGRIWVDPELGKGARICFTLPRNPELKSSLQMV